MNQSKLPPLLTLIEPSSSLITTLMASKIITVNWGLWVTLCLMITSVHKAVSPTYRFLSVFSLDDPVGYWGVYRDPEKVVHTGDGNTVLLFTKRGGHVGWPLGMNPSIEAWKWMSDVASSFAEAVDAARKESKVIPSKKY